LRLFSFELSIRLYLLRKYRIFISLENQISICFIWLHNVRAEKRNNTRTINFSYVCYFLLLLLSTLMILSVTISLFFFSSFLLGRVKNVERCERTFFFSSFSSVYVYAVVAEKYREERTSSSTTIKASLYQELIFFYMPMYIWIGSFECHVRFVFFFVIMKIV